MKKIKFSLDARSIDKAIAELREYREEIERKLKLLIGQLTQDGVQVARTWIQVAQGDSEDAQVDYMIDSSGDIVKAKIFMTGRDILFIEFGAGIHYNQQDPPHASEHGFGVNTYNPDSDAALDPDGWYYWTGTQRKHSYGTEGTYPMYHAAETIRNNTIQKAIEDFMKG